MAQKLENPYLLWLQTLQSGNSGYQQALTGWHKAVADAWQAPAVFWQTVASIQADRARTLTQWSQQAPHNMAQLAQAQGWPQWVGAVAAWQGQTWVQAFNLATATQAHRANLWQQWQQLAARNLPAGTTSSPKPSQPAPQAQPQAAPQPAPKAVAPQPQPVPPMPRPVPVPAPKVEAPQPQTPPKPVVNVAQVQAQAPRPVFTQASAPAADMPLLNSATGTHGAPSPAAVISPTAHSVVRSATGSTIAAAAAARRSVVARRQNRRRTPR